MSIDIDDRGVEFPWRLALKLAGAVVLAFALLYACARGAEWWNGR